MKNRKMLLALLPVLAGAATTEAADVKFGIWTQIPTTVSCRTPDSAVAIAESFLSAGKRRAQALMKKTRGCQQLSAAAVHVGPLVWSRDGLTVVRNLAVQSGYVIVLAEYDPGDTGAL